MKTFTKNLSGLLSASALAIGLAVIASPAVAQIATSVHDLRVDKTATSTEQICVYCHTPHGSADVVGAPLWNKTLSTVTAASYVPYISATMQGSANVSGGVSLACLSCHDGTQARNNTINSAGSGTTGVTGSLGNMSVGFGMALLGTNLGNDHPIGMAFCGTIDIGLVDTAGISACPDKDFNATRVSTNTANYWVDTGTLGVGTLEKSDLPLYGLSNDSVECATCHDPHLGGVASVGTFLRISNNGSAVCLTCHSK